MLGSLVTALIRKWPKPDLVPGLLPASHHSASSDFSVYRVWWLLGLATWRQALAAAGCTLVLALMILLLQQLALLVVSWRFERGIISFPLALESVTQAGLHTNLVGWGYIVNDSQTYPTPLTVVGWVVLSLVTYRLLLGAPVLMLAGGSANLIELKFQGFVLDWLIVPRGGNAIVGYSIGDLVLYSGMAWSVVAVCWSAYFGTKGILTHLRAARR